MAVTDNNNRFLTDCSTVIEHEFSFKIFKATDLVVSLVNNITEEETELELHKDYEVEISRIKDGGVVILSEVHPGFSVHGVRTIDLIQPEEVPTEGHFPEKTIEDALDRGCMIDQQQQEQIDRALKVPGVSGFTGVQVDLPVPKAENVLAWDSTGKRLVNYDVKQEIANFKSDVNTAITTFEGAVNSEITQAKTDFAKQITTFEGEVQTEITNFENEINEKITEVTEAAGKINELEEAVQTAVDKADIATQKATAAESSATAAAAQADRAEDIADEMETKYEDIKAFKNSFPSAVNLTTWARLNDGEIYNIPFDDVKADTNRFIQFENTTDRRSLRFKKNTFIKLETESDTRHLTLWQDKVINVEDYLDTGETLINGKDYSIFLVPGEESPVDIKISLNKTAPTGYDTVNTRRIGGFHTECADVGTISADHPMNGWLAGDIIPASVWTLWHRPLVASPSGAYYIESRDAWSTIYCQSGTMQNTVFEYQGSTTRSRTAWDHEVDFGLVGWEFPTSIDFTMSELGVIPLKAVSGKAESSCVKAGGWKNENNIRMVNNYGGESCCGGLWMILQEYGPCGGSGWATSGSNTLTSPRQYGSINRLLGGGGWDNSGYAGPSSRDGADSALSASTIVSARGWSRPLRSRQ